jgi:hypothetical protein
MADGSCVCGSRIVIAAGVYAEGLSFVEVRVADTLSTIHIVECEL